MTGPEPIDAGSVGVVIPVYRGRAFIEDAIAGVFHQRYGGPVRVTIVEDGSPAGEDCEDLVRRWPVSYHRLPSNRGVFAARLYGAKRTAGRYLAFLDQDDRWHPEFLSRLVAALEASPAAGFAAANMWVEEGASTRLLYGRRSPSLLLADLKVANQLVSPSQVLMRRQAFDDAALEPDLPYAGADDWLLWLAIMSRGWQAVYVADALAYWREHPRGAHHDRRLMAASERYVVERWFPRFGFDRRDQRRFFGRRALDRLAEGLAQRKAGRLMAAGMAALKDPWALREAVRFRRDHKRKGIV